MTIKKFVFVKRWHQIGEGYIVIGKRR